jgi:hypothetical protein
MSTSWGGQEDAPPPLALTGAAAVVLVTLALAAVAVVVLWVVACVGLVQPTASRGVNS